MNVNEVAVIGGGPAGAAVALRLARLGRRTVLYEATQHDHPRYGETLPPEINPVLKELDVWDDFLALDPLASPGILSAWGGAKPYEKDFTCNVHGSGWHVDRNRFDSMLCGAAEKAGAVIVRGWHCRDVPETVFVIDASGRNGFRLGGGLDRVIHDSLIAIVVWIAHPGGRQADLRTLIESAPEGWWYSCPLPTGETIAMFFTDPGIYTREGIELAEQLDAAPLTRRRMGQGEICQSRVAHVNVSLRNPIVGANWAAVGDSASSYDPISGSGIFKALLHSRSAAEGVDGVLAGRVDALEGYARRVKSDYQEFLRLRSGFYRAEARWLDLPFWSRRLEIRRWPEQSDRGRPTLPA